MTVGSKSSPEWIKEVLGWIEEELISPSPQSLSSTSSCQRNVQRIPVEEQGRSSVESGQVFSDGFQQLSVQRSKVGAMNTY
ncbi:hypothetical protein HYV70_01745 [Candidatus Uhrbacteria bacterium]|nr:hypothetical protein [Candidatus Uhrbacteria bacterium]